MLEDIREVTNRTAKVFLGGLPAAALFIGLFRNTGIQEDNFVSDAYSLQEEYHKSMLPKPERFVYGENNIEAILSEDIEEKAKKYESFRFRDEIPEILKHAERVGVEPELLMAIRMQENGRNHAYGMKPEGELLDRYVNDKGYTLDKKFFEYESEREKQLCWAAQTIRKNIDRWNESGKKEDFIVFLGKRWAPKGVKNDPDNLNQYWIPNVRKFYADLKAD